MIPNQYIPAVEKGVREQLEKESSPATRSWTSKLKCSSAGIIRSTVPNKRSRRRPRRRSGKRSGTARPVLLEPIVTLEVTVPLEKFGDISADLSTRRGHISGMEALTGGLQLIQATVPLSEVLHYATDLKSMTAGRGSYTMEFRSYEPVPPNVQQTLVDRYTKSRGASKRNRNQEGLLSPRATLIPGCWELGGRPSFAARARAGNPTTIDQ